MWVPAPRWRLCCCALLLRPCCCAPAAPLLHPSRPPRHAPLAAAAPLRAPPHPSTPLHAPSTPPLCASQFLPPATEHAAAARKLLQRLLSDTQIEARGLACHALPHSPHACHAHHARHACFTMLTRLTTRVRTAPTAPHRATPHPTHRSAPAAHSSPPARLHPPRRCARPPRPSTRASCGCTARRSAPAPSGGRRGRPRAPRCPSVTAGCSPG